MNIQFTIYHQVSNLRLISKLFNTISGVWNNPKVIGQCVMLTGGFLMEKISYTRAIIFGGSELEAGSAAAGSVYILDISILLNTVVCVLYTIQSETFEGLNFANPPKNFFVNFNFANFTI